MRDTSDPDDPVLTGRVSFIQHHLPPLDAGEYRLTVEQKIASSDANAIADHYITQVRFAVAGERFRLDGGEIDSVFPPAHAQGEFSNVLPHVVLKRRTLPWERSPTGPKAPSGNSKDDVPSWLALLLFDTDDPPPTPASATVLDLLAPGDDEDGRLPADTLSYGWKELDHGESGSDPCTVIDVPIALFEAIAPTLEELGLLAHARSVIGKSSASGASDYAVVVGNRLPRAGRKSTVHLVSLEGLGPILPTASPPGPSLPAGATKVRLISLASWSFDCVSERRGFVELLEALSASPLKRPAVKAATADAGADARVAAALAQGYTALPHRLRDGGRTVSFYRGPLAPAAVPRKLATPIDSADAALGYDPDLGVLDVSYAAAWQLGRLLALQNQEFASALHRFQLANRRDAAALAEQQLLAERIGADEPSAVAASALELLRAALAARSGR